MSVLVPAAARAEEGVSLVADGKAQCVIVLGPDASPSERWAAEQLQWHLREMSGAEAEIKDSPAGPLRPILLGGAARASLKGIDLDGLGTDGFAIRVTDHVAVAGGAKRGTMYGVFALLEKLGCRWWTPGESAIPKMKTVAVPRMEVREAPRLEYRDLMYRETHGDAGQVWAARNRVNGMVWKDAPPQYGGRYVFGGGNLVHTWRALLKKHGLEVKPEMLAMVGGKRAAGPRAQLCLTNPDAVRAMTAAVIKEYRENPETRFVVVGQEDGYEYCRCESCSRLAAEEESPSGPVIQFANQVAEGLEKEIPGAAIATAAYVWSRKPPARLRPRENVFIVVCSYECDFAHPLATATTEMNARFRQDVDGWSRLARKIFVWDYVTNFHHYLMPHPNLDVLGPNVKFFAERGAAGIMEQGAWGGWASEFVHLRMWVLSRLLWNPDLEGQGLVKEFLEGYYGPAAGAIGRYIDAMHRPGRQRADLVLHIYRHTNAPYLAPAVLAEAEAALREAEKAVAGDAVLERRVRHAHMPVWYCLAKFGPGSPAWRAVEAKLGRLDMAEVAGGLARVAAECQVDEIGENKPAGPWMDWLKDYAALGAAGGPVVPPELAGADLKAVRLIQACQLDAGSHEWERREGASDGWAFRVRRGRQDLHYLSDTNDFTPGRTYRLFVRVRGEVEAEAQGEVWSCGVGGSVSLSVSAEQLRDGGWHTFEAGPWKPRDGQNFYSAWNWKARGLKELFLDCLWLVESPAGQETGRPAGP